jgi:hypothetical protein
MVMEGDLRVPASLTYRASDRDTFNIEANVGRQHQVVAVTSQRVLSQRDTGTLAITYSPHGQGMQLGLIRQLYDRVRGELNWVLGPSEEAGVTFSITRGSDQWSITGKLQVWCFRQHLTVTPVQRFVAYSLLPSAHASQQLWQGFSTSQHAYLTICSVYAFLQPSEKVVQCVLDAVCASKKNFGEY